MRVSREQMAENRRRILDAAGRLFRQRGFEDVTVAEAGPGADAGIAALEAAVRADYPGGPATAPAVHDGPALAALRAD
ncbi:MAG: hypothetical protein ACLGHY_12725, partial [Gammaproteobacteria bacterium]